MNHVCDLGLPLRVAERTAHLVGLGQRAAGQRRDDLEHLLVEDDDAAGLLERVVQVGVQVALGFQPCRASRNGVTMSLLTGPGRNSEMSVMMSANVSGPNLPTSSR